MVEEAIFRIGSWGAKWVNYAVTFEAEIVLNY